MSDFARFQNVFGTSGSPAVAGGSKRRQKLKNSKCNKLRTPKTKFPAKESEFMLDLSVIRRKRRLSEVKSDDDGDLISSPNKDSIIQHISCRVEDFKEDPVRDEM